MLKVVVDAKYCITRFDSIGLTTAKISADNFHYSWNLRLLSCAEVCESVLECAGVCGSVSGWARE